MESSKEHITVSIFFKENKERLKLSLISSENGFYRKIIMGDLSICSLMTVFSYWEIRKFVI